MHLSVALEKTTLRLFSSCTLFDPLDQFFQLAFVSFHSVAPLLSESADLIVSFIGPFIVIFLQPRRNFGYLRFFFGCCCVSIFTQTACN